MKNPQEETKQEELDCPFDFTSRCTMGRCDCKTKQEQKQHLIDLMKLDEELGLYEEPEQEKERGITINHIGKQETLEEGLLQHIKFCLKNESQAIRLIEKYGFEKQEQDKKCFHPLPYRLAKSDVNYECTLCGKFI
jgi:hypothetical protein